MFFLERDETFSAFYSNLIAQLFPHFGWNKSRDNYNSTGIIVNEDEKLVYCYWFETRWLDEKVWIHVELLESQKG